MMQEAAQAEVRFTVAKETRKVRRPRFRIGTGLAFAILVLMVFVAIFAPWLTPHDPVRNDLINGLLPPMWLEGGSPEFVLGTDTFGRDVLTRLMYGARVSLLVVIFSLLIAVTLGAGLGLLAGYVGGRVDVVIMRFVDVM